MPPKSRQPAQPPRRIPLPEDLEAWKGLVRDRGLEHHTLGQIASHHRPHQRFSGSCLPDNAFLQLRALWPPSMGAWKAGQALRAAGFFTKQDEARAQDVLRRGDNPYRGTAKVHKLIDRMAKTDTEGGGRGRPPRTPDSQAQQVGWLGGEWEAMSQARRKFFDLPPPWSDDAPTMSPRVVIEGMPDQSTPGVSHLDLEGEPQALETPCGESPSPGTSPWSFDEMLALLEREETPSKPQPKYNNTRRESPIAIVDPPPITPPRQIPTYNHDTWRTLYEVQSSHFFDKFISGFIDQIFPGTCRIGVTFQEQRYRFRQDPTLFTASPDAVFFCREGKSDTIFALVEIKPFRRVVGERAIHLEETAEMVAYLSEQSTGTLHSQPKNAGGTGYRLMISFDRNEFWFVLVSFGEEYLDYIQRHDSLTISPLVTSDDHMISFQRFGPFSLDDPKSMDIFTQVLLAILLHRIKLTTTGSDLYRTLGEELDKHVGI